MHFFSSYDFDNISNIWCVDANENLLLQARAEGHKQSRSLSLWVMLFPILIEQLISVLFSFYMNQESAK